MDRHNVNLGIRFSWNWQPVAPDDASSRNFPRKIYTYIRRDRMVTEHEH